MADSGACIHHLYSEEEGGKRPSRDGSPALCNDSPPRPCMLVGGSLVLESHTPDVEAHGSPAQDDSPVCEAPCSQVWEEHGNQVLDEAPCNEALEEDDNQAYVAPYRGSQAGGRPNEAPCSEAWQEGDSPAWAHGR
jgi:hypothetical protein